jgi:hypothetical protein
VGVAGAAALSVPTASATSHASMTLSCLNPIRISEYHSESEPEVSLIEQAA